MHLGLKGRQLQENDRPAGPGRHRQRWACTAAVSARVLRRAATAHRAGYRPVLRPEVLIFDEPTTGLNVTTQARIVALLKNIITDTRAAALYISHSLTLISSVADWLLVMYAGKSSSPVPPRM
jgi:ABC-type transporter Mla maintaining outer membrane lipid asymmetry ATPase subunit MlaF